jgi:hypothetical protein
MDRPVGNGLEDEEIERALEEVGFLGHGASMTD